MGWRPPLLDALIAAAFLALTVAEVLVGTSVVDPVLHLSVVGGAMVCLAWRRRFPLLVAAVVIAADVSLNSNGQLSVLLSLVLVCFTVGFEPAPPRSHVGLALVLVPFLAGSVMHSLEPSDLAAAFVFLVGPWALGYLLRNRIARADAALARAELLEQERELEAARAAAEERTRIARELHDIVSHSISVVTIQTQAVRRRLGPEHAAEAADLAAVEATAREALAEMRRLFGVLRSDGQEPDLAPQPGMAELERLLDQVRSGNMRVRLQVEGEPVPLSPGVDLAAYRIVQEGLTNALRHSGAAETRVLVRYLPGRLALEVEDDGRGLARNRTRDSPAGHGLVGIRERVSLYGGTVTFGRGPLGGARLVASLPLGEAT